MPSTVPRKHAKAILNQNIDDEKLPKINSSVAVNKNLQTLENII